MNLTITMLGLLHRLMLFAKNSIAGSQRCFAFQHSLLPHISDLRKHSNILFLPGNPTDVSSTIGM